MQDTHISLAHGNGGRYMRELIEELFEDEGYRDPIDADLTFELSSRDEEFLKKHGIKF